MIIRPTTIQDAVKLPAIERSAGHVFRTIPDLAWIADDTILSIEQHLDFIAKDTSWIAVDTENEPEGFLCASFEGHDLHIWELAVHVERQKCGLGSALITRAITEARKHNLNHVTLTTFRALAWNEHFYVKLGFVTLEPEQMSERLQSILHKEVTIHGLPKERRCAMQFTV